jgi:hypothetical protein
VGQSASERRSSGSRPFTASRVATVVAVPLTGPKRAIAASWSATLNDARPGPPLGEPYARSTMIRITPSGRKATSAMATKRPGRDRSRRAPHRTRAGRSRGRAARSRRPQAPSRRTAGPPPPGPRARGPGSA